MEASRWGLVLAGLALVLSAPFAADEALADEHVDEDEPHVLIEISNDQDEAQEANVSVQGPSDRAQDVTIPAGETWTYRHAGPPGDHEVRVRTEGTVTDTDGSLHVDNDGCLGPYRAPFSFSSSGTLIIHEGACLGEPARFHRLVDEAREAREAQDGEAIHVPHPRDASEGQLLFTTEIGEPEWEQAYEVPFRWLPNATFPNAWGERIEGTEVVVSVPSAAQVENPVPVLEGSAQASLENRIRYADDWRPVAQTQASFASASVSPLSSSSTSLWDIRYDREPGLFACLFRHPFQSGELAPASQLQAPACLSPDEGDWWTGPLEEHRGFPTVTLYGLDDIEDPSEVTKLRYAHGIAQPIAVERFALDQDGNDHHHVAYNLSHLEPDGDPLDDLPATQTSKPPMQTGALRPLEGPQLADDERFPFPLADAVEAARQDPALTELQAVLDDEAVLAQAHLSPDDRTDAGQARELVWRLKFTTAEEGPVNVECRRPAAETGTRTITAPAADCREPDEATGSAERAGDEVPQLGPQDIPTRSVTWDEAVDRWSIVDRANASAPVTLASYHAPAEDTDSAAHEGGTLRVGADGGGPNAGPTESRQAPTTVAVDAEDGRTRVVTTGTRRAGGLANPTGSLSATQPTAGPSGDDGLVSDTDKLVGAAAGAGLLSLLAFAGFALYNRLQEDEVLADATRREIRALVEAQPGIHGKAIARQVAANERTVEHHVDILVREDVLTVLERGGYNHHFVKGQHTPKEMQALASLQRGKAERVYELVRQDPGVDLSTLAEAADISKPYASKLVSQLVDVGLVDKVRQGRRSALYANPVSEEGA